ncbi:MAG TPA: hypothetical protein VFS48_00530 [Solirubrobacterales bacterium]|nr:hypothetical protein [Solirubrobacterales bacterium]
MLLPTINVADGREMTAFDVDPSSLPRRGDHVEIANGLKEPTAWVVDGIVWSGHPGELKPKAIRLMSAEQVASLDRIEERVRKMRETLDGP